MVQFSCGIGVKSSRVQPKVNNEDDFSRGAPLIGADPLYTATQVATWQAARKVAIEPIFDLLSKLWSITGAHKPKGIQFSICVLVLFYISERS